MAKVKMDTLKLSNNYQVVPLGTILEFDDSKLNLLADPPQWLTYEQKKQVYQNEGINFDFIYVDMRNKKALHTSRRTIIR
jgi:hypothetical protein